VSEDVRGQQSHGEVLDVTGRDFDEQVLRSPVPVLVDFWAEWCGPCRQLAPVIKQLASEYQGKLRVAKVDADANPDLAAKFQIRALPTLLLVKGGAVRGSLVGSQPKATLARHIDSVLAS
jgi:thioredoxin 1